MLEKIFACRIDTLLQELIIALTMLIELHGVEGPMLVFNFFEFLLGFQLLLLLFQFEVSLEFHIEGDLRFPAELFRN